mgnify:CR=1 FL=1
MGTHWLLALPLLISTAWAQAEGGLRGQVTLEGAGKPLHHATISILKLNRSVETDEDGMYELRGLPPGVYDVVAHLHSFTDSRRAVAVGAGGTVTLDFVLRLAPVREQITVTASGREQTAMEAFQSVTAIDTLDLAHKSATSLGEVLQNEPGVAKRSFGPGTSRPVIRGFDGDRVLVLRDGMPTGTLSSQSGDHGEPVDATTLERLEVVRGPATLLYGSNAIGGVVNAITGHHQAHQHPHEGLRGHLTTNAGSGNAHAGASAGFEYGVKQWLFWGHGGGQRTGDYRTPLGTVPNSGAFLDHASGGLGRYGEKLAFNAGYSVENGRYGVPFASRFEAEPPPEDEPVDLTFRRHNLRFHAGAEKPAAWLDRFDLIANYSSWNHNELSEDAVQTRFFNKQFSYRGVFEQRRRGRLSGSFGFSGMRRSYKAIGAEILAPPVTHDGVAAFGLEEIEVAPVRFQLGGRLERNAYDPTGLRQRSFTGLSGAAGMYLPLWSGGALAANYSRAFRAPALEELYNRGPHIGNLAFEIGNPNLAGEHSHGLDLSVRHQSAALRAEANLFSYWLDDFVFLAPTGQVRDRLMEAAYLQADSRYRGLEARLDARVHSALWLNLGLDVVDARLRAAGTPLPRIPPVRGRIGFDARYKQLSLRPGLVLANAQRKIFPSETPTAGYALVNLDASYTIPRQHFIHVFAASLFNAGDRLYRNHLSLIKELAPEIGRGVKFTYSLRFF